MAKYGPNEMLPKHICPYCRKRRKTKAGGGSACSSRACIAALNADSVGGGERPQTANGETVWVKGVRGRSYKVLADGQKNGKPCFKLKDKQTGDVIWRPIDQCEIR